MAECAALDEHAQSQRKKEHYSDEDQNTVEFKSGIAAAGHDEGQRTDQEHGRAIEQLSPQRKFGGEGIQATSLAGIVESFGPTVQATRHREIRLPSADGLMLCGDE